VTISMGSDHAGFALKETIKEHLKLNGYEIIDVGCFSNESTDYPVYGIAAAERVMDGSAELGIVVCSTGVGISIAANKVRGIRCGLCHNVQTAELSRRHNNANMLALGASQVSSESALEIVDKWLAAGFEGGRHARRVGIIDKYDNARG